MIQLLTDVCIEATLENVSSMRKHLTHTLQRFKFQQSTINAVQLAFSEVASNFIEHSQSIIKLIIMLRASESGLELYIAEYTPENNPKHMQEWLRSVNTIKEQELSPLDVFDLERSGGRGAGLIAELVDKLEYKSLEYPLGGQRLPIQGLTLYWNIEARPKRKHILIVDDDRSLATLYKSYLSTEYVVTCVDSVEGALALVDQIRFDLILSDIHMPVYNGIEFREKVSTHQHAMSIPFIFMSGDSNADKHQTLSNLGIDDFITKPISKAALLGRVTRTITRVGQLNQLNDLLRTQSITQSLLPKIPSDIKHWHINAISEGPNSGGGDLLIVKKQRDATLIIVADLMGHDVAAKFFSHAYLGYIRGVLCASSPEPEEFLQLLSNALYEDELLSKSLCTCCAIKLKSNGMLRVASAGHPAPMIISRERQEIINIEGMLPGLMPNIVYASMECQLAKDERLAIFTDGFIDPSDLNSMASESSRDTENAYNQILSALVESLNIPLQASLESVFKVLKRARGGRVIDDTLLVLAEPTNDTD